MNKTLTCLFLFTLQLGIAFGQPSTPRKTSVGCISGNCENGIGAYQSSNGNLYEGEFVSGKYQGKGKITFNDGDVYQGMFSAGKMNGDGIYTYSGGNSYSGSFSNGSMNGNGVMIQAIT